MDEASRFNRGGQRFESFRTQTKLTIEIVSFFVLMNFLYFAKSFFSKIIHQILFSKNIGKFLI